MPNSLSLCSTNNCRFYTDYINLVDYTLNTFSRFVQENNTDLKLFYKYMMIQMFDEDEVSSVFEKRFDTYLLNGMNFGNGLFVPFLKYTTSNYFISKKHSLLCE